MLNDVRSLWIHICVHSSARSFGECTFCSLDCHDFGSVDGFDSLGRPFGGVQSKVFSSIDVIKQIPNRPNKRESIGNISSSSARRSIKMSIIIYPYVSHPHRHNNHNNNNKNTEYEISNMRCDEYIFELFAFAGLRLAFRSSSANREGSCARPE